MKASIIVAEAAFLLIALLVGWCLFTGDFNVFIETYDLIRASGIVGAVAAVVYMFHPDSIKE